jgi:hypothetical protein
MGMLLQDGDQQFVAWIRATFHQFYLRTRSEKPNKMDRIYRITNPEHPVYPV